MTLKELRTSNNLTQSEASMILNISLRSYKEYENNISKQDTLKYEYLKQKLEEYLRVDEEHGYLSIEEIKTKAKEVLDKYDVNFCYLFGSYAKGCPKETSDVDLLIDTKITGLDFFGLIEEIREILKKKVDLLKVNQLYNNSELLVEILKDGIKIYG